MGASLMVVTPLAVTPLDLRPQSTIAVPAVQHTVDYQLELVAASLPFFLSGVFSSGLPADYLPKAIAAFGSSSDAATAYLEGAPKYFGILADAVRKDPSTLPAAVSRVVYDVANIIDRTSLAHAMSGAIIHSVFFPFLSAQTKALLEGLLRTGDNVTLELLKATLPEPLGADGKIVGLPALVTTPWSDPFGGQDYPPKILPVRRELTGTSASQISGGTSGTFANKSAILQTDAEAIDVAGAQSGSSPESAVNQTDQNRSTKLVDNTRFSAQEIFKHSPLIARLSNFAGAASTKPAWTPGSTAKRVIGNIQRGVSDTLSKINDGVKKTLSGGSTP